MSALRKPQTLNTPNAGHRWDYTRRLFTSGIKLSSDAKLLLYGLVSLDGPERLVNPGIRYLSELTSLSAGRCMAARDELVRHGIIRCDMGIGTRSTVYHLADFDAWFAARSVPVSPPSVPDPPVSVHTVGTKPLEPQESEKKAVLRIVREGWPSLVHLAPIEQRDRWLVHMTFDGQDADGTVRLTAPNSLFQTTVKKMFGEDPAIIALARKHGIDPEKVKIRSAKAPGADLPPSRGVNDGDSDGYDQKRSMGRQFKQNMERLADKFEAASDQPVVPSRPQCNKITDLSAYRTRKQVETGEDLP
jgi:hypothetical protein